MALRCFAVCGHITLEYEIEQCIGPYKLVFNYLQYGINWSYSLLPLKFFHTEREIQMLRGKVSHARRSDNPYNAIQYSYCTVCHSCVLLVP